MKPFDFGPGADKKSSVAVIFPVAVGQNVISLRASVLDEEVPLLINQHGSGEAAGV